MQNARYIGRFQNPRYTAAAAIPGRRITIPGPGSHIVQVFIHLNVLRSAIEGLILHLPRSSFGQGARLYILIGIFVRLGSMGAP